MRHIDTNPLRPAHWWRLLCPVTDRIFLCGDLPPEENKAAAQIKAWRTAGVTAIVDLRAEASDEDLVARLAPELRYVWLGTHDDGGWQDDSWFNDGVAAVLHLLASQPDARVVIHCHMGVNRAPSMAFAVLLAQGFDPINALETIRLRRPIAAMLYADSAIEWWLRRQGESEDRITRERIRVSTWLDDNPVNLNWVISRIRLAGGG